MENKTVYINANFRVEKPEEYVEKLAKQIIPHMHTIIHKDIYHQARCVEDKNKDVTNISLTMEGIYKYATVTRAEVLAQLEEYFKQFAELKDLQITFKYK